MGAIFKCNYPETTNYDVKELLFHCEQKYHKRSIICLYIKVWMTTTRWTRLFSSLTWSKPSLTKCFLICRHGFFPLKELVLLYRDEPKRKNSLISRCIFLFITRLEITAISVKRAELTASTAPRRKTPPLMCPRPHR